MRQQDYRNKLAAKVTVQPKKSFFGRSYPTTLRFRNLSTPLQIGLVVLFVAATCLMTNTFHLWLSEALKAIVGHPK
jgi:hypothetical protein